jgi:hypothetical protein
MRRGAGQEQMYLSGYYLRANEDMVQRLGHLPRPELFVECVLYEHYQFLPRGFIGDFVRPQAGPDNHFTNSFANRNLLKNRDRMNHTMSPVPVTYK